jgi:ABC-type Na+ efflux pump permease subunit
MREIGVVARLELKLLLRGRGIWIAVLMLAALGVWSASGIREQPSNSWTEITYAGMLCTLLLTLSTGNAVQRDTDRRVGDILLSTPVSSAAYVFGKYLVAVVVLLGLSLVDVVASILADRFDGWRDPPAILGHSHYPGIGPAPYLDAWVWLIVTPVIFGGALALAAITLTRGQRVLAYTAIVLIWFVPAYISYTGWPLLLDLTGARLVYVLPMPGSLEAFDLSNGPRTPAVQQRIMELVRGDLPPAMPAPFVWSRVLFLALAILLVALTIWIVARRRRGRALIS